MTYVVTAGPTREHLDPVRFLSNPSTGKMGFAVAARAARRGHKVILIAGPVSLKTPQNVTRVDVVSARDMLQAVCAAIEGIAADERIVFVSTAAVADFRPAERAGEKLKKHQMSHAIELVPNPDILKSVHARFLEGDTPRQLSLIGFAAETNRVCEEAARKCREKHLKFIVANDVTEKGSGFGTSTNRVTFVFPSGKMRSFPQMSKAAVATRIVNEAEKGLA